MRGQIIKTTVPGKLGVKADGGCGGGGKSYEFLWVRSGRSVTKIMTNI